MEVAKQLLSIALALPSPYATKLVTIFLPLDSHCRRRASLPTDAIHRARSTSAQILVHISLP